MYHSVVNVDKRVSGGCIAMDDMPCPIQVYSQNYPLQVYLSRLLGHIFAKTVVAYYTLAHIIFLHISRNIDHRAV